MQEFFNNIWKNINDFFRNLINFDEVFRNTYDEFFSELPELVKVLILIFVCIILVLGIISFIKKFIKFFLVLVIIIAVLIAIWYFNR